MEAADVADTIREAVAEEREAQHAKEQFRARVAIVIAVLAMLLAISTLGGENATKEMITSNIQASDTWAFYQAKTIRQTSYSLAADQLQAILPTLPADQQAELQRKIEGYRTTIARYESESDPADPTNPLKGGGKKELTAQATAFEHQRTHAQQQDPTLTMAPPCSRSLLS